MPLFLFGNINLWITENGKIQNVKIWIVFAGFVKTEETPA